MENSNFPSTEELVNLALNSPKEFINILLEDTKDVDHYFRYSPRIINNIIVDCVEYEGGSEGEGENVHRVLRVTKNPVIKDINRYHKEVVGGEVICYISISGSYNSYDGTEWYMDSPTRVYPRQVVVTQYFNTP